MHLSILQQLHLYYLYATTHTTNQLPELGDSLRTLNKSPRVHVCQPYNIILSMMEHSLYQPLPLETSLKANILNIYIS